MKIALGGAFLIGALHLPGRVRLLGPAVPARLPPDPADARRRASRWSRCASGPAAAPRSARSSSSSSVRGILQPARQPAVRPHDAALPALPGRGRAWSSWSRCASRASKPLTLGRARRARHRHDRPGRRVGLVVRLVDDRVAGEHAGRGRRLRLRRGRRRRRARRLHRPRAQHARAPAAAGAALRPARRGRGGGRRDRLGDADLERRPGPRHASRSRTPSRRRSARSTPPSGSTRPTPPTTPTGSSRRPGRARRAAPWSRSSRRSPRASTAPPSRSRSTATGRRRCACTRATRSRASPVYFPEDKAIPVKGVPAEPSFTREFKRDKELLQREQKSDVPGALVLLAYLTVLLIGVALYASMGWGLALLQRRLGRCRSARVRAAGPSAWGARCRPRPATP